MIDEGGVRQPAASQVHHKDPLQVDSGQPLLVSAVRHSIYLCG